jgi:brefeldin A-inhibited guanine nucleotide-exchange protein
MFIDTYFEFIMKNINNEVDSVSKMASESISDFVILNSANLNDKLWSMILQRFKTLFEQSYPKELLFDVGSSGEKVNMLGIEYAQKPVPDQFPIIVRKCVMHLGVIDILQRIFISEKSSEILSGLAHAEFLALTGLLEKSYLLAKSFNGNMELRKALQGMGFMRTLPNLLKQESCSVTCYLTLLFTMYVDERHEDIRLEIEEKTLPYFDVI